MKSKVVKWIDYDSQIVIKIANELTQNEEEIKKKIEKIFYYVRDDIKFGFNQNSDLIKASDIIKLGIGQCNNKSILFVALCKAIGIPAKIRFSLIKKEIQKGLFTGIPYILMPKYISHSWAEIEVEGKWRKIDSYINDESFYQAGKEELRQRNWDTGFSVSCSKGSSSSEFNIDQEKFVQMDAVVKIQDAYDEANEYFLSKNYKNKVGLIKSILYKLTIKRVNQRIQKMRNGYKHIRCSSGLCGK